METLAIALGHRIRKERRKCGLSQDVLALTSNLDRSYIGRIERGEVNITIEKLYRIAKALDCDPAGLLPLPAEVQPPCGEQSVPLPDELTNPTESS